MRTIIIDNYDSFTINLYQLIASINQEEPIVVRNDHYSWSTLKKLHFDNIVLSPGPGNPMRSSDFGVCLEVLQEARVPLLGVCLGHQGLGYTYGGTIDHAPEVMHGRLSAIYHNESQLFQGIPQGFCGVRYHSLVVSPDLPPDLEKIAWTSDGIIMGLRHTKLPFWGVQFHPESISTEYGAQLMQNFRDLTASLGVEKRTTFHDLHSLIPQKKNQPEQERREDVSVYSRKIEGFFEPEQVFDRFFNHGEHVFWLDSSRVETGLSRFSFMGDASGPLSQVVTYNAVRHELTLRQQGVKTVQDGDIFEYLDQQLRARRCVSPELPFDFNAGFVGYFGYELKRDCGATSQHPSTLPDAAFLFADRLIAFDHREHAMYLVCLTSREDQAAAESWFDQMEQQLATGLPCPLQEVPGECPSEPLVFRLDRDYQTYLDDIQRCMDFLHEGESYEFCLTNRMYLERSFVPFELYRTLRRVNPAPYAAFMRFEEVSILSSSPERFLRINGHGLIESKPIKGTAPRGATPEEDAQLRQDLHQSDKDRSENLMIVDLIRNDLGLVCDVGSVSVPRYMNVETYETVHQLVSTIQGHLRPELSALDCIRGAFPGGSMTGAPKLRTMELLEQLELRPREVYSGAIGYLGLNGSADLNIVIRTILMTPGLTSFGIGGAIVALSDPEMEFEEILLKGQALIRSILLHAKGEVEPQFFDQFKAMMKADGEVSW